MRPIHHSPLAKLGLTPRQVCQSLAQILKARTGRRGLPEPVIQQMYADYQNSSLAKVGQKWGRKRQSIYFLFKERGLALHKKNEHPKIVWQGRNFTPGKSGYYRATTGDRRPLHHLMWENHTGRKIPDGWQVTFKNGDKTNFAKNNLHCAPLVEVTLFHQRRLHPSARFSPEQRHERRKKYGRDYMAAKAAAFIARGLRSDGKPRAAAIAAIIASDPLAALDLRPFPPPPSPRLRLKVCPVHQSRWLSNYEQNKARLGLVKSEGRPDLKQPASPDVEFIE